MGTPREQFRPTPVTTARIEKRMTQADLAAASGISTRWLSIIERGYVPLTHMRTLIAAALDSTPEQLWPQLYEGIPEPRDPHAPRRDLHKRLHDARRTSEAMNLRSHSATAGGVTDVRAKAGRPVRHPLPEEGTTMSKHKSHDEADRDRVNAAVRVVRSNGHVHIYDNADGNAQAHADDPGTNPDRVEIPRAPAEQRVDIGEDQ